MIFVKGLVGFKWPSQELDRRKVEMLSLLTNLWGGVVFGAADVRSCKAHTSWYHGVKVDLTVLKKVIVPS